MVGDKLLGKLWDTVTKDGIGSLASPWQTRRQGRANADARRDELLMLAQTEVDVADIKSGKKKLTEDRKLVAATYNNSGEPSTELREGRVEPHFTIDSIEKNSDTRFKAQRIQEQINLTKTVLYAEEELENNYQEGSDQDIDPDWFIRWRDCAKKVSSEELQRLWAKALAGEIVTPGSYSLRTLEFIKNISKQEAHEISRLAPYAMAGTIYQVSCIDDAGLEFSYLLEMEDLGILSGVKGGGLQRTVGSRIEESYEQALFHNNKILIFKHESAQKKANFPSYKITRLGCEVLRLGVFPMEDQYLEQIGIKAKQQGFEVILADWVQTSKEYGNYYNPRTL
ncbi:DUF2806 domain-containing protein [Vibrio tasmaniensis]|uniref:DUF2806 domain-containing protein n=1 Tax=Vibrio tasmaniensis TaxID=212663 RepID=UPI00107F44D9|nr:DUF2806 domain-containing protein [Vibrio tasmaniensis]